MTLRRYRRYVGHKPKVADHAARADQAADWPRLIGRGWREPGAGGSLGRGRSLGLAGAWGGAGAWGSLRVIWLALVRVRARARVRVGVRVLG